MLVGALAANLLWLVVGLWRGESSQNAVPQPNLRDRLLQAELEEVDKRQADSLHHQILIDLAMTDVREQVGRPSKQLITPEATVDLPAATQMIEVFRLREVGGRLLLLGDPGAGKTTMLLELAKSLLETGQQDPQAPVPVILELSTWREDQKTLADWLIEQLWQQIQSDPELLELSRLPLLLHIMVIAYQGQPIRNRQDLFDAYVLRRFELPPQKRVYPVGKEPSQAQTRHYLVGLAKQMQTENETEFLIERLQPSVLATRQQKWLYRLIFGLIFGLKTDLQTRLSPNEGIKASARNVAILMPPILVIFLSAWFFLNPFIQPAVGEAANSLFSGLLRSTLFISFYYCGGLACVQHFALRIVLW